MKYLGIDLGGTNVAAAVVDSEGTILGKVSLPTPRGAEAVADQMAAAARGAAEAAGTALDEVVSVGIGAPGAIEPDTGVIKYWSNLDFTNVPITALMKARLDKEILLENDANAAALGEYAAGAGKGSQSMVAVTLGTGVGGGAILNGKLYTGFNYAGMEIGHFVIEHGGRLCTCGRRGCFEAYCSATALIKRTRQVMEEDRTSRLWELAGSRRGQGHRRVCGLPGLRGGQPGQHLPAGGHLHRRRPLRPGGDPDGPGALHPQPGGLRAQQPPPHPAGTGGPGQRRGPHWRGAAAAVPVELQG